MIRCGRTSVDVYNCINKTEDDDETYGKQSESGGCQRIGGRTHGILSYSYCDSCVNK